ncbi:MAG: hypothetical protein M1826_000466 [Phylliscum demangeonii]|nr:MAG: hypothetical protein M1826_000466 [Phylliscum demangeonii]
MGQDQSTQLDETTPTQTLQRRDLASVAKYIKSGRGRRIVVLAGAGISTSAGIPDFRSPDTGLYANLARLNLPYPEAVFDIDFFRENPAPFYSLAHELYPGNYRPTITHSFIRLLADKGRLLKLFTQNIDCLERDAGIPREKTVEAHGSFATHRCIDCKTSYPDELMRKAVHERQIPCCPQPECRGLVKPDIVFFREPLPDNFHRNSGLPAEADLCIVLGTSLTVQPFASLPSLCQHGVPRLLINLERVGGLGSRPDDVLLLTDCDAGVRELAAALGWLEELEALWATTNPEAKDPKEPDPDASLTSDEKLEREVEKLTAEMDATLTMSKKHDRSVRDQLQREEEDTKTLVTSVGVMGERETTLRAKSNSTRSDASREVTTLINQEPASTPPGGDRPPAEDGGSGGTTPRAARPTAPSSSPLFFHSSPVRPIESERHTSGLRTSPGAAPPSVAAGAGRDEGTVRGRTNGARDSSPLRYASSSSPARAQAPARSEPAAAAPASSSSGLFVGSSRSLRAEGGNKLNVSRRGDIHSDFLGSTPSSRARRRLFVDERGFPVRGDDGSGGGGGGGGGVGSDAATYSQLNPNTSDADVLGGASTRVIWGTNVSIPDTMSAFKHFLLHFTAKYRMWADGATEEETRAAGDQAEQREYVAMMRHMRALGIAALNLDVRNLKAYPATRKLWYQLQAYPQEVVPLMDQLVKDVMADEAAVEMSERRAARRLPHRLAPGPASSELAPASSAMDVDGPTPAAAADEAEADLVADVEARVYKIRPFGLDQTINLRDLNPADMDKMIAVKGLVIRTTPIIPDMKEGKPAPTHAPRCPSHSLPFFRCQVCQHTVMVGIDRGKIAEPTQCPRPVCESANAMQIVHNRCRFADKQVIKLQETPDHVPDGQTPHAISLCAYDELVDLCKAGDRIEVTGIFRGQPMRVQPRQRTIKTLFRTYVDVLHIQKVDRRRMGIDGSTVAGRTTEHEMSDLVAADVDEQRRVTADEEARIAATGRRPDVYELLARSLAPSVYELADVKKGILLQLFGGTNKSFAKGGSPQYRGDINVLLCGDPSTAKSQLLQYVHAIAPRGIYTSGKGSSAVGLTAYVTRDPETRQLVLESGALVLSDGGVCCIDEFDKMTDSTRSVLHEVMEQQTVSIAKAGIITTLNARTSILASANPIGSKYNPNLPVPANIDLPPTLLSRFDLVYLVLDRVDERNDRRLARHLVSMYLEDAPAHAAAPGEILPVEFLTAYISYARAHCSPQLTAEACEALVESYVAMRQLGDDVRAADRRITATTRQLESMIRLAEAHAKMRLAATVTADDVAEAVRLIRSALKQAATDPRTGLIDMSRLTDSSDATDRHRRQDLRRALLALLDEMTASGAPARYPLLLRALADQSSIPLEPAEVMQELRALEHEGLVSMLGEGPRRAIRRLTGVV